MALSKHLAWRIPWARAWHQTALCGPSHTCHLSTDQPLTMGSTYRTVRQFSQEDVTLFLNVTGDANPIHTCADAAKASGFPSPILPGIMMASLFPAIIGSHFPGAVYLTQSLAFKAPAQVGVLVHAEVTVKRCSGDKVMFDTVCYMDGIASSKDNSNGLGSSKDSSSGIVNSGDSGRVLLVEGTALALIRRQVG